MPGLASFLQLTLALFYASVVTVQALADEFSSSLSGSSLQKQRVTVTSPENDNVDNVTLSWAAKLYVGLGIMLTLSVIVAAWYLVWELILKQIKFLRKFLDQQVTSSQSEAKKTSENLKKDS